MIYDCMGVDCGRYQVSSSFKFIICTQDVQNMFFSFLLRFSLCSHSEGRNIHIMPYEKCYIVLHYSSYHL